MGTVANVLVGDASITLGVGVLARVIGYTVDGATMTVRTSKADIKVEEDDGTIIRRLIDQEVDVTLNVAEGAMADLAAAIPGAVATSPTITTIGGGTLQSHRLTLVGINPAGLPRVIVLTAVNPTGEIGVPYKKGEVSVVPMTFSALVSSVGVFGSLTDAAAVAPTLLSPDADTKSNAGGTAIEAQFSVNMANPAGKHLEFWFTEVDTGIRAFSAATVAGDTMTLTVTGVPITAGKLLALYYALGTITSVATGVLASFAAQTVVPRP